MRVLVSVDMEGAAAVVDAEDVSPGTGEYERNRRLLTEEANAAVRGVHAFDPGAQVTRRRTSRPPTASLRSSRCSAASEGRLPCRARVHDTAAGTAYPRR
jgi:hypothetical protein